MTISRLVTKTEYFNFAEFLKQKTDFQKKYYLHQQGSLQTLFTTFKTKCYLQKNKINSVISVDLAIDLPFDQQERMDAQTALSLSQRHAHILKDMHIFSTEQVKFCVRK